MLAVLMCAAGPRRRTRHATSRRRISTACIGKKRLKAGQLQWIAGRNNICSRHKGSAFYVNLECATDTTVRRGQFLQDRLRECVSAGRRNSKR
jgi:uncharacterized protein YecT (DUF1311 family)